MRTAANLFNTYGGRLYAYFRFMIGDDGVALRALADTVVGAAGETGQGSDPGQSAVRIFTFARVECRRHQHAATMGADGSVPASPGASPGPVSGAGRGERLGLPGIARLAVSRLSPDVREAFVLSAVSGDLSLPELAKVMGMHLEEAADLRANAGLDFVRALALCAEEADYTMYSGAEMRRRAEASLARDAEEKPPSLPFLDDAALAPFRERGEEPPPSRDSLPMPAPAPALPAMRPTVPNKRPDLGALALDAGPLAGPLGAAPPGAGPLGAGTLGGDAASPGGGRTGRLDGEPGHHPDDEGYGRGFYDDTSGFGASDYGPPDLGPAGRAFGQFATRVTGQFTALTGPFQAAGDRLMGDDGTSRRKKLVLAGAGGIAAVAIVIIAVQVLAPGGNDTISLTHAPAAPVMPSGGGGMTLSPPSAGPAAKTKAKPSASQSPAAGQNPAGPAGAGGYPAPVNPAGGGYSAPAQPVQPPAQANPQPTAPRTTRPAPNPTFSTKPPSPAPKPTTTTPTSSASPTPSPTGT